MIGHLLTAHFKDAPKDTQVNTRFQINPLKEIIGFKNLPTLLASFIKDVNYFFEIFDHSIFLRFSFPQIPTRNCKFL